MQHQLGTTVTEMSPSVALSSGFCQEACPYPSNFVFKRVRASPSMAPWGGGWDAHRLTSGRSFLCNWSSSSQSSCPPLPLLTSLSGLVFWLPGVTLTARVSTWGQGWFGQTRVLWPRFAPGAWVTWPSLWGPRNSLLLLGSGKA